MSDPSRPLPGSSIHGSFQARVLKWGAIAFSIHHANPCKYKVGGRKEKQMLFMFHLIYVITNIQLNDFKTISKVL